MPAIGSDVVAEGRDLVDDSAAVDHAHGPILLTHRSRSFEERLYLGRGGRRGEVIVCVGAAEQFVAERAAYAPRLIPCPLESAGDLQHLLRDRQRWRKGHEAP